MLEIKDEAPDFIIKFLKMIQVRLKVPVRHIRTDNETDFVNQTLCKYYEQVGISHETLVARSPQQNDVVERRNCTLIEAARTMLIYAQALLFSWAERNDWDFLFQPLFDELLIPPPSIDPPAPEVIAPIADVIPQVQAESIGLPSLTTVDQEAPSPSKSQTTPETQSFVIPQDVEEDIHDIVVAHIGNDPLFSVPVPEVTSAQSSSMKYGFESCDPVDTTMVKKSKLDEDKEGKAIDSSHYRGELNAWLTRTMDMTIDQKVVLDEALVLHTPFFKAFLVTSDVPEIYMQEF
nr:ribonuclease H-like domain-containing protein [Tanacetum cinerariifolium]